MWTVLSIYVISGLFIVRVWLVNPASPKS